jgi:potassium efflux system protein
MQGCGMHLPTGRAFSFLWSGSFVFGVVWSLALLTVGELTAQENPTVSETLPTVTGGELTTENIQVRLKIAEDSKDLDPSIRTKLIETYTRILEQLRIRADAVARSEQFTKQTREAPDALQELKTELARPVAEQQPEIAADAALVQVQQLLSQAETNLAEAQKGLHALQDEPKRRANRRIEIPKLAEAAEAQLQEIDRQLDLKPSPDVPPEVTTAARLQLDIRKQVIAAEGAASQAEFQFFEATGELLAAQRDRAARRVAECEGLVRALTVIVNERRRKEAEWQALEAGRISAQAQPAVRSIAEANAELARKRQETAGRIESTTRELEQIDRMVTALDAQFTKITKRYETAGATEAIGLLLRRQRDDLPDVARHQREIRQRSAEISGNYLELIDYEEQRTELATLDQRADDIVSSLSNAVPESNRRYLEFEVRSALEAQRDVYDSLIADTNSLLDKLVELDVRQRQLIARSAEYAAYCDERILWIRSATMIDGDHLRQCRLALLWLADPSSWADVLSSLRADTAEHPMLTTLMVLFFGTLLLAQRPLRMTIVQLGEQASRSNITTYLPTLRAFLITGFLTMLWPGLAGYLGLRLVASENSSEFVRAIGHGLTATAVLFATLELFRHICRRQGLGESHFAWDSTGVKLVRQSIWWFMACGLPLMLVVTLTEAQSSETVKNSLGRLAFIGLLAVLSACVHQLMRPGGGVPEKYYSANPQSWAGRLKYFWYLLAIGSPVTLALLAFSGYYYTALQLAWRLLATWWLIMGLLILHATLIRWSLLSYRDLAMRKARERRAAAEAAPSSSGASTVPSAQFVRSQQDVALSDINKQSRKALQLGLAVGMVVGLWLVWVDVLPALGALRHVELWMTEVANSAGGTTTTVAQPVTLADLLLAAFVASLTLTASRNLPSLLQIAVLQRLPLDSGVRYAIITVCQYAITTVGLVTTFGLIGIGWYKVQWLVAAISVGLGFGLQEIFANFISGLILLFERPVRLGDIVTVGEVTGTVTGIQMRATTITDWDMRELVVPNREFITGRVMNWTLSSTVSRMSIVVGVAYGTDPDLVRELLMRAAAQHPLVLKDPVPHALFNDFGDSTLTFVLRVYMANRETYLELRHTLLTTIAHDFHQAGVEFAFPQRDIHIRSDERAIE